MCIKLLQVIFVYCTGFYSWPRKVAHVLLVLLKITTLAVSNNHFILEWLKCDSFLVLKCAVLLFWMVKFWEELQLDFYLVANIADS